VTDSGIPEVRLSSAVNGLQVEAPRTSNSTVAASTKSSSWDADWGPKITGTANSVKNSINTSSQSVIGNPVGQVTSLQNNLSISGVSNQQTAKSCPSVDLEWPPRASSGVTSQFGDTERQTVPAGTSSTSNLEDDDPFADWPPRPSGSLSGGYGNSNNGSIGTAVNKMGHNSMTSNSGNLGLQSSNNWSVNSQNSVESIGMNPRNSSSSIGNPNNGFEPQSSLGFLKQSQAFPAPNAVSSSSYNNNVKSTDLGSIFSSNKNEQIAPRLAPPPSTTVGRGRGRGRGATSTKQSSHTKSSTDQPPLLDLLG
jgi:SCY1-like protein 2